MFKSMGLSEFIKIISLMKHRKYLYMISLFLSCAAYSGYQLLTSFISMNLINAVLEYNKQLLFDTFIIISIAMTIACVIDPIATYLFNSCIKKTMIEVRLDLFSHIEQLPYSYINSRHSGDIISTATNDLNALESAYGSQMYWFLISIIYGISSMITMLYLNWELSILSISLGIISYVTNIKFAKSLRNSSDKVQYKMSRLTQTMIDIVAGIRTLRIFTLGNYFMGKFMDKTQNLSSEEIKMTKINSSLNTVNFILTTLSQLGIFCVGAFLVFLGKINFGTIVAIIALQNGITFMFLKFGNYLTCLQSSLSGASRIFNLMDYHIDHIRDSDLPTNFNSNYMISLNNVTFGYIETTNVIDNLSINIKKGDIVTFVGPSGGGKSTILKLALGFYTPDKGDIFINGKNINSYSKHELTSMVALVPQDIYLFDDTIMENIRYGRIDATYDEIIFSSKQAYAHDFIIKMCDGYETKIGENGCTLSVGQKQRIAIARAILKDAPIILLDEPTSALDLESEQYVKKALRVLMQGKTTIIVSHRLSTLENADKIIVIEDGKVVEEGSHDQLLNNKEFYSRLCKIHEMYSNQSLEEQFVKN